jgi:hypothetical protein
LSRSWRGGRAMEVRLRGWRRYGETAFAWRRARVVVRRPRSGRLSRSWRGGRAMEVRLRGWRRYGETAFAWRRARVVVRRPRSGRPSRSSPEGRAKAGWEAGIPANSFSSFRRDSLRVAKPFIQCELGQNCFFVRLLLFAGSRGLRWLDVTRNVTRRERLPSLVRGNWVRLPKNDARRVAAISTVSRFR